MMKIDVESIKALEPGKIYVLSIDAPDHANFEATAKIFQDEAKEHGLRFIILGQGVNFISAPPELVVTLKNSN